MEEQELDINQENSEATEEIVEVETRKTPNEKRNTIIILGICLLLAVSLTSTIIVGSISGSSNGNGSIPVLDWTTNKRGVLDEKGNVISNAVYDIKIEKDDAGVDYARINDVKATSAAKEFVLPTFYGIDDVTYKIYSIGNSNNVSVFKDGSGSTIEGIYTQSLYREIKPYAFSGLASLKKVSFMNVSEGNLTIGSKAFSQNPLLKTVELPKHLKILGSFVFEGCSSLETITIPKNVTSIDEGILKDTSVKDIYFEGSEGEWMRVVKHSSWDAGISNYELHFLK